jgi:alpha-beta hydrolase superfamily lysophospholipase
MFSQTHSFESPTGAKIAWRHESAKGDARAIVMILHGMSEHAARYAEFAGELAARGFHVYAHDHRGHGETHAPDAVLGQFARKGGADKVIADVVAMRDMALSQHPGLPVFLFGHSMGGLICLNVAIAAPERFAGFAVWNCDFSAAPAVPLMRFLLGIERWLKGSDVPSSIMPRLTFEAWGKAIKGHRTLFDWLSSQPEEVDAYIADPLCGFDCTVSLWEDVTTFIKNGASKTLLSNIPRQTPFHLLGGGKDPASKGGKAITWLSDRLQSLGFVNVTTVIYPDARHETLNDTARDLATSAFADWLDKAVRLAAPS